MPQRKFNENTALCFYTSIFHLLYYCLLHTFNYVLEPQIVLQRYAIVVVYGARKYDNIYPLFQLLKILSLRNSYVYSVFFPYIFQTIPPKYLLWFLHHKLNCPYTRHTDHFILILPNHITGQEQRETLL